VVEEKMVHPIMRQWLSRGCDDEDLRVAVEFHCGCCCKKASNARLAEIIDGLLVLEAAKHESITVKMFADGKVVDREKAKIVIIPLEKICSVEITEKPCCCDDDRPDDRSR
jgi:alpha-D-ribose 1-methylphosphonate 5-triphosphate synthase subunit PhnH